MERLWQCRCENVSREETLLGKIEVVNDEDNSDRLESQGASVVVGGEI